MVALIWRSTTAKVRLINEAFVIDEEVKARLISEDPKSAEVIKPWLRGRDIRKWQAEWAGLYIIAIASSGNREWPWSQEQSESTALPIFEKTYPAIHRYMSKWEEGLRKRDDKGRFWWELRSCIYWAEFDGPKISWSHFATTPEFVYDEKGFLSNDKSYIMPINDLSVLGILNSRITNFFLGQLSPPVRGGFMELRKIYLEQLPIPPATATQQAAIVALVEQILRINSSLAGFDSAQPTDCSLSGVEGDSPAVPQLETEIDRLVYTLYGLTDEEIAVVEGKPNGVRS